MPSSFRHYARAARGGLAEAEYRVGRCYLEGSGVPPSSVEGVRWLERAANRGFVAAQAQLAGLYVQGLGAGQAAKAGEEAGAVSASLFDCRAARP